MARKFKRPFVAQIPRYCVNEDIHLSGNVRVTGEGFNGEIVPIQKARRMAEENDLDLIEINHQAEPPVVRIANYEKMVYEMKKNAKKQKQSQKPIKEIQLTVSIAEHDLQTKANKAKEFIEDGSKVRVVLTMKGRELIRREENKKSILDFIELMSEVAKPEAPLRDEGNKTVVILRKL